MRFLRELSLPALKCERLGHRERRTWRRGYVLPGDRDWRAVAVKVRQERCDCARCGVELAAWSETDRSSIQSFTAPESTWDRVKAGDYWPEGGRL
jgi:hypothetical protein